jgi:leucyl aminopeptidase
MKAEKREERRERDKFVLSSFIISNLMRLEFSPAPSADAEVTVRLLTKEERSQTAIAVPAAEFSGAPNSLLHLHGERLLYVGLGEGVKADGQTIRSACGAAAKFLQAKGRTRAAVDLGEWGRFTQEAVEGALLGAYRFRDFKTPDPDKPTSALETLTFASANADLELLRSLGERGRLMAEATNFARQVGNQPGNLFYPETLAEVARRLARESDGALEVNVLDEDALCEGGFGGLLAVGGGSKHPPRLIVLRYNGGPADEAPLALVGKSITFDSGGISIKPAERMEEMIWDKCGGTAVLGAMRGVASLKPRRNIVAILASAENLTGPGAYRPGDIVTVFDGKRIEINNTDAEGRVVLADAIGYARRECKPSAIIDLATLTGACIVALGETTAGLWSTSNSLREDLLAAAKKSGESFWAMPLLPEHEERIKSDVALIKNSSGRPGGACTAAAFLKNFAGDTPWAHIDLAGPSATTKDTADSARGATGFAVRTLLELVTGP